MFRFYEIGARVFYFVFEVIKSWKVGEEAVSSFFFVFIKVALIQ